MKDIKTMFWRCMLKVLRTPQALVISIAIPAILMFLFVVVMGGSMDVGDYNVANFIVPGILVYSLVQSTSTTGVSMSQDMTTGMVNRFRSMAIPSSAFLTGHVLSGVLTTIVSTIVLFAVAFASGFRPTATLIDWLVIIGLILLLLFSITWVSVFIGVTFPDAESAGGILQLLPVLVFLSSAISPTETMPRFLRYLAENQPFTPFVNTIRALMNGYAIPNNDLQLALIWWGGILVVTFLATIRAYKNKLTV